jgi:transcriptional regulator with XRE-family HTH domain
VSQGAARTTTTTLLRRGTEPQHEDMPEDHIVRQLRKAKGLTQNQLAAEAVRRAGVKLSGPSISQWETGQTKQPERENVEIVDEILEANGALLAYYRFTRPASADTPGLLREVLTEFGQLQAEVAALTLRLDDAARERRALTRRLDRLERELSSS